MVHTAIIGIGGFGGTHVQALETLEAEGRVRLIAVAEKDWERNGESIERLKAKGVRMYTDYHEMLRAHAVHGARERSVDLVTIATPLHLHPPMTIEALRAGYHVLTEKPPAVTIQDLRAMRRAEEESGMWCGVDFQLLSGKAFRKLQELVLEGALGDLLEIVGVGKWKRLDRYYERASWPGKVRLGDDFVLDGPINNPLSHILNNVLHLARSDSSRVTFSGEMDPPVRVRGELYRGHPIEGEDTSCLAAELEHGCRVYFYATLCHTENEPPWIEAVGTKGKALWTRDRALRIEYRDGRSEAISFEDRDRGHHVNMFRNFVDVLEGNPAEGQGSRGAGGSPQLPSSSAPPLPLEGKADRLLCPLADTEHFVLVSNGAYESAGNIVPIGAEHLRRYPEDDSMATEVVDIGAIIEEAARKRKLFSEIGVPWARRTAWFDVRGYEEFRGFG